MWRRCILEVLEGYPVKYAYKIMQLIYLLEEEDELYIKLWNIKDLYLAVFFVSRLFKNKIATFDNLVYRRSKLIFLHVSLKK